MSAFCSGLNVLTGKGYHVFFHKYLIHINKKQMVFSAINIVYIDNKEDKILIGELIDALWKQESWNSELTSKNMSP